MLYIIVAILIFGVLVATHELGHFATAKLLGVKVNEFAIGMGPVIWQSRKNTEEPREGEGTVYSLRLLPIGGFCALEGDDEDSADPRSFGKAAWWKKIIILCAGAFMNFITGVVIIAVLYAPAQGFRVEVFGGPLEGYGTEDCGLLAGDRFLSVDGHRVLVYGNARFYLDRAGETIDFIVERDGQRVELKDVHLPYQERVDENGNYTRLRGLSMAVTADPTDFLGTLGYSWKTAVDFVRLGWISLGDLITGAVGLRDMSGPVGIVNMMGEVGSQSPTLLDAAWNLGYLAALIAVNLAVMNLLPLPALDGGRVFFLALNGLIYGLFRRKIDAKYEGYVHLAGLAALMCLMLAVTLSDVGKLFGR
ncbi:MAG: site-2 protease family protein [Lawsonibacter sp.]|jgi:regulator of sigma E protease|nr:site-2 protease family protein [Lawsonibacter sp.]MCI8989508.1 site-2 protease family protein [Lawsonibacter sp.]MCI9267746.1 site-2 protease family protein [Lawsonibacter sp.]